MKKYLLLISVISVFFVCQVYATPVEVLSRNTIEVNTIDGNYSMPKTKRIVDVIFVPGNAGTDTCVVKDMNGATNGNEPVTIYFKSDIDGTVQIYNGRGVKHRLLIDFSDSRTSLSTGALLIIHTK